MGFGFDLLFSHSRDVQDDDNLLKMVLQSKPVPFLPSQIGASASSSTLRSGTFLKCRKGQGERSQKLQFSKKNIGNFKKPKRPKVGGTQEAICDGTCEKRCYLYSRYIHLKYYFNTYTQVCFTGNFGKMARDEEVGPRNIRFPVFQKN